LVTGESYLSESYFGNRFLNAVPSQVW